MKTRKGFILASVFALVTLLGGTLMAEYQDDSYRGKGRKGYHHHHKGGPKGFCGRLERMQEELDLTDAQMKQIFDLHQKYERQAFENRNNRDKLKELRKEHRDAVKSVLTPEQQKKMEEMRAERRCRRYDRDK